jgi:hypothetical protein
VSLKPSRLDISSPEDIIYYGFLFLRKISLTPTRFWGQVENDFAVPETNQFLPRPQHLKCFLSCYWGAI